MRLILTAIFMAGTAGVVHAHTLDGETGIAEALSHQLVAMHHLPLTALLIAGGAALINRLLRQSTNRSQSDSDKP